MVRVRQPGEGGGRKGAAHSPGRPQNNTRLWREARASLRIPVSPTVAGGRALKLSEVTGASVVENVAASQTAGARAHGLVETDDGVCVPPAGRQPPTPSAQGERERAVPQSHGSSALVWQVLSFRLQRTTQRT